MLPIIKTQEEIIEKNLQLTLNSPTEDNKKKYLDELNLLEYIILNESEKYSKKSREHFELRKLAFSCYGKYAKIFLSKWILKYGNIEGCPHKYEDTLNIPFRKISIPNSIKNLKK